MTAKTVGELRFSQSIAASFQRCAYKFQLNELQGLLPRYTPAPLRRGTLVAIGMEAARRAHFEGETCLENLVGRGNVAMRLHHDEWLDQPHIKDHVTDDMREDFERQSMAAGLIFARGLEFIGLHEGRWETLADNNGLPYIEYEMSTELEGFALGHGGKLDWLVREVETGHVWIWDDKTHKRLMGEEYYDTQRQANTYLRQLRDYHDVEVTGNIMFQMRAHVPEQPKMNTRKSKGQDAPGMSVAKCATDWKTYRQALLDNGLNPDDYQEMVHKLTPFDKIDRYYRTPKEVDRVWQDSLDVAENLLTVKKFPRNLNPFNCNGCNMRSYCLADLRGHDTEFLAKTEYVRDGEPSFFPATFVEEDE